MTQRLQQARAPRRLAIGAEPIDGGTHFRVWAPRHTCVAVALEGADADLVLPMDAEAEGYFSLWVDGAVPGHRYWFAVGPAYDEERFPDPASRYQPEGPHGPSEIVDPSAFVWTDGQWPGVGREGHVLYEIHVGTFTRDGTWRAAVEQLPELARLGITVIEVMPVAEFSGTFGWGYDGVDLYAPTHLYGAPDDFRAFVDRAHALKVGVILDVVYNHLGPDGCYLAKFSDHYFSDRYKNEWGKPPNFDGDRSVPTREFYIENAGYWVGEFHLDGLRLDATQSIPDASPVHVIADIAARARRAAGPRGILLVAENEPQHARLVRPPAEGGYGLDAVWNDDFHHAAIVASTGLAEAYYTDYAGSPQEFVSAAKRGYLYQGQRYSWQKKARGEPTGGIPPLAFVHFLENHDQVANTALGERLHQRTSPAAWRALTALVLLGPNTPMLFQGQEFAASAPFVYFADHPPPVRDSVREGRREFLSQFPTLRDPAIQSRLLDPADPHTFERCKIDPAERERHREVYALYRDLIALRRGDPAIAQAGRGAVDGAVLSEHVFVLRYFGGRHGDRLLIVNLGRYWRPSIVPEPLLAPPAGLDWSVVWSSEDPAYGGSGTPAWHPAEGWVVLGSSTLYLRPL